MAVSRLMSRNVVTIAENDEIGLAIQRMLWSGIRHLPVMRGEQVVGILSERDILRHRCLVGEEKSARDPVSKIMREPVSTVTPDATPADAAAQMAQGHLSCLPVIDGTGALVGIVTSTDILMAQAGTGESNPVTSGEISVGQVMTESPVAVRADDYVLDAAARMNGLGVRHLPVVDGEHRVLGILSDRDVRAAVGELNAVSRREEVGPRLEVLRVSSVMTSFPVAVLPETPLVLAVASFVDWRIGALPVVDGDRRLVGIVSYIDALSWLLGRKELESEAA